MTEPDYYKILGLTTAADNAEIRQAYRRKVRDAHPDAGGDPETFHELQVAYETLTDPVLRLEYDAARGNRRPPWGNRRRPGRHTKNHKVKAWRVNTTVDTPAATTGGEVMSLPWFVDIDPHKRLRYTPSVWHRTGISAAVALIWTYLTIQASALVLAGTAPTVLKALIVPYMLLLAGAAAAACFRSLRPARPTALIAALAVAALIVWLSGATLTGIALAAHLAATAVLPWTVRRIRVAARLRTAVRSALKDFNAFAPSGAKPSADRRTGAVLRTLLERLPAARLFVRVPVGAHRAEYTVVCGRRVAVIAPPIPRTGGDSGAEALPGAVHDVSQLLSDAQVRGFVVWPHLPVDRISGADAVIRHLSAPDAAGEIGRWLASDPYTLHLPTLRRLRDRLASADAADNTRPTSTRSTIEV